MVYYPGSYNRGTGQIAGIDPYTSRPYQGTDWADLGTVNPNSVPLGTNQQRTQGFSFGNLSGPQSIFYNDPGNRGVAWQMLKDYLNPTTNGRYGNFLDNLANQDYNRYLAANARQNGALKYTNWLEQNQYQYASQYQNQSPSARGANPSLYGGSQMYLP